MVFSVFYLFIVSTKQYEGHTVNYAIAMVVPGK